MIPEPGDPNLRVTEQEVSEGFRRAGAMPGDLLFYHGSMRSMGHLADGPATFIAGALAAVEPAGTVAAPTLWYHDATPPLDPKDFDLATSPSYVGSLTEALRVDPRSIRSNQFSHSVSAIGPRAAELTADHGAYGRRHSPWSDRAFADASPWVRLYEWNALYCFVGVTMRVCTMKHYIEARLVEEALRPVPAPKQEELRRRLRAIDGMGTIWPFYNSEKMEEQLKAEGLIAYDRIGSATLRAIRARPLVERTYALLEAEPAAWFSEEFLRWLDEAKGGSDHALA
jgi:aminoglycoside N3'-acetyltransferase